MKKSVFAAAVATAAMVTAANAGYWGINGMSASGVTMGSGNLTMYGAANAGLNANLGGSAGTISDLDSTEVGNILSGLGITLATDTVTYFSWEDSSNTGLGYFGVAFKAGGTGRNVSFTAGEFAGDGSFGVNVSGGGGSITADVNGNGYATGVHAIAANTTFMLVFGGFGTTNAGFNLNGTVGTNTAVQYLGTESWNSSYSVKQSGSTNGSSGLVSLSIAAYTVPVPAPALIAGAGLVGAAALRRRMAKKA